MTYSFDVIKNRSFFFVTLLSIVLLPLVVLGVLCEPEWEAYLPGMLYRNWLVPIALFALLLILTIYNKQFLFWGRMNIVLDNEKQHVEINGKEYQLQELDFYEFQPGNILVTGSERDIISLKFKGKEKLTILPCKSSESISDYDAFVKNIQSMADKNFDEDKERLTNKALKYTMAVMLVLANLTFLYFLLINGKAAFKIVPGLLVAYGIFLPLMFRKKRKRQATSSAF